MNEMKQVQLLHRHLPKLEMDDIIYDACYGIADDMDWSYYHYNEADLSLSMHHGDWQIVRTIGISIEDLVDVEINGKVKTLDSEEYYRLTCDMDEEKLRELEDTFEPHMDINILGEFAQTFINVKTHHVINMRKVDDSGNYSPKGKWKFYATPTDCQYFYADLSVHPLIQEYYKGISDCSNNYSIFDYYGKNKMSHTDFLYRILTDAQFAKTCKTFGVDGMCKLNDHKDFLAAYKIANRHKYTITNGEEWLKLLEVLTDLNKDIHNPIFICPDDLSASVRKWTEIRTKRANKIMREKERERRRQLEEQAKKDMERMKEIVSAMSKESIDYEKKMGQYLSLSIKGDGYTIEPLHSVAEFYEEGTMMQHCVFRMAYYKKFTSLILSVKSDVGERMATIELDLNTMKVKQCYAFQDSTPPLQREYNETLLSHKDEIIKLGKSKKSA